MPVSNFAPEFIALYREGSTRPVVIDKLPRNKAVHLQHRLHRLRQEMRKEQHEMLPVAERCTVRSPALMPDAESDSYDDPVWQITVEPADADFAELVRDAGVEVTEEDFAAPETPETTTHQVSRDPDATAAADAVRKFINQK